MSLNSIGSFKLDI